MHYQHDEMNNVAQSNSSSNDLGLEQGNGDQQPFVRSDPKIGRNDSCHCGS